VQGDIITHPFLDAVYWVLLSHFVSGEGGVRSVTTYWDITILRQEVFCWMLWNTGIFLHGVCHKLQRLFTSPEK
jgi:hypothetical protein